MKKIFRRVGAPASTGLKTALFSAFVLFGAWLILTENFNVANIFIGAAVSALCVYAFRVWLPLPGLLLNVRFIKLIRFPFSLIKQIYIAGINAIKIIFTGADSEIITIGTDLKDTFLQTVLTNSITLTPGSVSLNLDDGRITILRLKRKDEKPRRPEEIEAEIKGPIERILLNAERRV